MEKIHNGDEGTVISIGGQSGIDLTTATAQSIYYQKPDGTTGSWTANITDGEVAYTTVSGNIDQVGVWYLQAYVELTGGWKGTSDWVKLEVLSTIDVT